MTATAQAHRYKRMARALSALHDSDRRLLDQLRKILPADISATVEFSVNKSGRALRHQLYQLFSAKLFHRKIKQEQRAER